MNAFEQAVRDPERREQLRIEANKADKSRALAHDILQMSQQRGLTVRELQRAFDWCRRVLDLQPLVVNDSERVFKML